MAKEKSADKDLDVGTDFYHKKGLSRSITVHVSPDTHEKLRVFAFQRRASIQETLRAILEDKLEKVKI